MVLRLVIRNLADSQTNVGELRRLGLAFE